MAEFSCKPGPSCLHLLPGPLARRWERLRDWFWRDMTRTHLLWIKLIFFFQVRQLVMPRPQSSFGKIMFLSQSGSMVVLYPYLVIHMRSLGLSVEEVAIVNGVVPVADIVGPPMAGFIADRIGNFRYIVFVPSRTANNFFVVGQGVHVRADSSERAGLAAAAAGPSQAPRHLALLLPGRPRQPRLHHTSQHLPPTADILPMER